MRGCSEEKRHAMLCTKHVFGIHRALSLHPGQSRCAPRKVLTSADAACPRHVSLLRMMHHCIMAPGFAPKVRLADRPQGRRHWDWHRNWFPMYAILAV